MRTPENRRTRCGSASPETEDPYLLAIDFFCFYKGGSSLFRAGDSSTLSLSAILL